MVELVQQWEYKVVDLIKEMEKENIKPHEIPGHWVRAPDIEAMLNQLGRQGWKLVNLQFLLEKEEPIIVGFFKRQL